MNTPKDIKNISPVVAAKRLNLMREYTNNLDRDVAKFHVSISTGNTKTGALVPSVSLRPVLDCGNCSTCSKLCYDLRNDCCYPSVQKSRARNAAIWRNDPDRYFNEISAACKFFVSFRWHVGGDIVNAEYLAGMVRVAHENLNTKFLVFTKRFDLVNGFLDNGGKIPENLQIIFSDWVGLNMVNPYNFPTSHPVFSDGRTTAAPGAAWCPGNCSECLVSGRGCWTLKKGEQIKFAAH